MKGMSLLPSVSLRREIDFGYRAQSLLPFSFPPDLRSSKRSSDLLSALNNKTNSLHCTVSFESTYIIILSSTTRLQAQHIHQTQPRASVYVSIIRSNKHQPAQAYNRSTQPNDQHVPLQLHLLPLRWPMLTLHACVRHKPNTVSCPNGYTREKGPIEHRIEHCWGCEYCEEWVAKNCSAGARAVGTLIGPMFSRGTVEGLEGGAVWV